MKVINLGNHSSVINSHMAQLRDVTIQGNRTLFRRNLERIARAMAYEVSRTLDYSDKIITTPLGTKPFLRMMTALSLVRYCVPVWPFMRVFSIPSIKPIQLSVAAYREEGSKEDIRIHVNYIAAPDLNGCTFLMVDPMLATGGSLELSYKAFLSHGTPAKLHICCAIAAQEGIDHLCRVFPEDDITLWVAAVDPELNDEAYIVPGLGDAGDLSFGPKL